MRYFQNMKNKKKNTYGFSMKTLLIKFIKNIPIHIYPYTRFATYLDFKYGI